jgi:hypothetical protein
MAPVEQNERPENSTGHLKTFHSTGTLEVTHKTARFWFPRQSTRSVALDPIENFSKRVCRVIAVQEAVVAVIGLSKSCLTLKQALIQLLILEIVT